MEHCNACDADVEDVEAHVKTTEHLQNLEKIKNKFKSKVYGEKRRGIDG